MDEKWRRENMNLALMFNSWGVAHIPAVVLSINNNHRSNTTSLVVLDRLLCKLFHADEVPNILRKYSPALDGSIIEFLCQVDGGAVYILDMLSEDIS